MQKPGKYFFRLFLTIVLFGNQFVQSQNLPFWNEIQAFKKQDSIIFPAANAILFIGSSSFTMWKDIHSFFPGYPILNRGFGGSTLLDQIKYVNEIVYPYKPKQIFIYCGENDLASSDTVTSEMVYERFVTLYLLIRKKFPGISVIYVFMKPSPSRIHLMPKMAAANEAIKRFLQKQKNTGYIDVYHHMLTPDGKPMEHLFLQDKLHMNASGYRIWQRLIRPNLLSNK